MTNSFPRLFEPVSIANVDLKNRIVSASHGTRMSEGHCISERELAYYEAKARGATGLIVLDGVRVSMATVPNRHTLLGSHPEIDAGYRLLAARLHRYDTAIFGQLLHQGAQTVTPYSRLPLVSASAVASPITGEIPHALTEREIAGVVREFAESARKMRNGGLDGIEVHCAHGYLVGQFLSPRTNLRRDRYGGPLENRMRFALEILENVRDEIGSMAFGIRINSSDLIEGGCTAEEMLEIVRTFHARVHLDFVSVSAGTYAGNGLANMVADFGFAPGFMTHLARPFREALPETPVMAVGRINSPQIAERILAAGDADLCAITRAIIADPEFAAKARQGKPETIRPCIAANTCLSMNRANVPITCSVNPTIGVEARYREFSTLPMAGRRKVFVIGGGPAGLEAARVAALRGHEVTLFEREGELGGQLALTARIEGRKDLRRLIRYYENALKTGGVSVNLDTPIGKDHLAQFVNRRIIFATGAKSAPAAADQPGKSVVNGLDLLRRDPKSIEGTVLVLDRDHYYTAPGLAHYCRQKGARAILLSENPMIGAFLPPGALPAVLERLASDQVELRPLSRLLGISGGAAQIENRLTGVRDVIEADHVVIAGDIAADDQLFHDSESLSPGAALVGDAVAPRQLWQAVRDGFHAALMIDGQQEGKSP